MRTKSFGFSFSPSVSIERKKGEASKKTLLARPPSSHQDQADLLHLQVSRRDPVHRPLEDEISRTTQVRRKSI
jgi:hypothetical protein